MSVSSVRERREVLVRGPRFAFPQFSCRPWVHASPEVCVSGRVHVRWVRLTVVRSFLPIAPRY